MPKKIALPARGMLFTLLLALFGFAVNAQTTLIKGIVKDNAGKAVDNASVIVKGTAIGTVTAADGSFAIAVPSGKTSLLISSLSFETKELDISDGKFVNVNLASTNSSLNEVVVTGYSTQRKKDITGAVSVVNVADMKTLPAADATAQLQGKASGVTVIDNGVPGASASVRIRGLGSFSNNSPLYVIDGVQAGSIAGLNPNDIESMQVLKDAASASIYGVKGSNGVIVITTKKGKKRGVNVSYDMYYGSQNPGTKGFDLLNAQEEANLLFLANKNSGINLSTKKNVFGNGSTPVLPDYIYYTGYVNDGTAIMNGNPGVNQSLYSLDNNKLGDPAGYTPYIIVPTSKNGTNWYAEATRNAPIQNHNLTMSGMGDNSRFMLSLNYFNQQAITNYQFFKRYTARLNSEFNVLKNVRVGENLQIFFSNANVPGQATDGDNNNNQENSVIAQTMRPMAIIPVYTSVQGDFAGTLGGSGLGTWGNAKNPVAQLYRTRNNRSTNMNIFGNIYAEVDFLQHFTFRTSFGGSINDNNGYSYPFIEYEHTENTGNTTYSENFIRNNSWIWTNQVNYKNSWGKHVLGAVIGTEAQKYGGRQIIAAASSFYTYNYQPYINLQNGGVQNLGGSNVYVPTTYQSYFAKADYSFDGKYLLSATVRRDGSSKFVDPNKWGTFPAFSVGWRASEESFLRNVSWLNDLKIRGSWGIMGNEAPVSAYNAFTTFGSVRSSSFYDLTGSNSAPQEGFILSFTGNKATTWEKGITTNIGFDATLFNNTTNVVFDWYQKKTDQLLFNPPGQAIGGAVVAQFAAYQNVGSMVNKGIDLMINNRSKLATDFTLITAFTLTTYNNKITKIADGVNYFEANSPANEANRIGGAATRNMVNSPLNAYYGYQVVGLFQTAAEAAASGQANAAPGRFKFADVDGNKVIDANDRTVIGNPNPKFSYGFNLGAEYKAFDFSAFFYGVSGKDAFNFTRWWTDFSAGFPGGRSKRALYDSWLPDGSRPNATTPIQEASFNSGNTVSSYYVENASYFRLRNLQIGYTLPGSLTNKIHISKARIYLQATNLFTITKYTGLNPEITSNANQSAGVDVGSFPTVKQFLFGLNVNF